MNDSGSRAIASRASDSKSRRIARELERDEKATTANVGDDRFVTANGTAQARKHVFTHHRRALGQTFFDQDRDRRERRGAA